MAIECVWMLEPGDRVMLGVPFEAEDKWEDLDALLAKAYPNVRFDPFYADLSAPRVIFVYRDKSRPFVRVPTETTYLGVKER